MFLVLLLVSDITGNLVSTDATQPYKIINVLGVS